MATNRKRRSPTARRRLTRTMGITASPSGAPGPWPGRRSRAAIRQRTRKGPTTDDAGVVQQRQAPEPDQGPPVRRAQAEHLQGLGQRPGREQVAAEQGQHEADDQGGGEGLLRASRANEVRNAPRPHMAAVAPTHIRSTPSGSPQSAPKTAAVTPQTIRMDASPVRRDGQELAATRWRSARTGAAASRASVPFDRSSRSERMPSPLPMKRNTTAIDGAK